MKLIALAVTVLMGTMFLAVKFDLGLFGTVVTGIVLSVIVALVNEAVDVAFHGPLGNRRLDESEFEEE